MKGLRFPAGPLLDLIGTMEADNLSRTVKTVGHAADRLAVNRVTISNWKVNGLTVWQADRCAIRLGLHPVLVWPDFHDRTV